MLDCLRFHSDEKVENHWFVVLPHVRINNQQHKTHACETERNTYSVTWLWSARIELFGSKWYLQPACIIIREVTLDQTPSQQQAENSIPAASVEIKQMRLLYHDCNAMIFPNENGTR